MRFSPLKVRELARHHVFCPDNSHSATTVQYTNDPSYTPRTAPLCDTPELLLQIHNLARSEHRWAVVRLAQSMAMDSMG